MKRLLKRFIPKSLLLAYHRGLSYSAARKFGFPSQKMTVIGVTGTNGKTTVSNMIGRVLEAGGHRVGVTTTANFKVADREWLNDTKMTMLGRTRLQGLLAEMVEAKCDFAVVETSSEGIVQSRHADINYDTVVFTNLTPEHLESHGGFENYKKAKGRLFAEFTRKPHKNFGGHEVAKTIVANLDSEHAEYFLGFSADRKLGFTLVGASLDGMETIAARNVMTNADGCDFDVDDVHFHLNMPGLFNVENALAAVTVGLAHGVSLADAARGLAALSGVPGRMEFIDEGQSFRVLVDYAPEPESFRRLYEAIMMFPHKKIIHVLGSCGGGRDRDRRPVLGRMAAANADIVIVTNEDPYDDNPLQIIEEVAAGARAGGKVDGENLFLVDDRKEALSMAVKFAAAGDLVVATGKGAEQAICIAGGRKLPWDERSVLRDALKSMKNEG